jgi:ribose transport system ATP-binding protein
MSVTENMTLVRPPTGPAGLLDLRSERRTVNDVIDTFGIRPASPHAPIGTLSGGNQQKVVLAKWLDVEPALLVLDEPVQGVDIGAKADIYRSLRASAGAGMALLMFDSDFDNLAEVCDRVLVLRDGRISDELTVERMTPAAMSRATFGVADTHSIHPHDIHEGDPT